MHDLVRSRRGDDPGGRRFHWRRLCLLGVGLPALGCDLPRRGDRAAAAYDGVERVGAAQNSRRKCAPLSEPGGVIATAAWERQGDRQNDAYCLTLPGPERKFEFIFLLRTVCLSREVVRRRRRPRLF